MQASSRQTPKPVNLSLRTDFVRTAAAVLVGIAILVPLTWLLARLVWLWFFFGLYFFLLATLLAGAPVFRILKPRRPMSRPRIGLVCALLVLAAWYAAITWEYRYVAATAGNIPAFSAARTALFRAGRPPDELYGYATTAFLRKLQAKYAPGGVIGYVRWAAAGGKMELAIDDIGVKGTPVFTDTVSVRPMEPRVLFGSRWLAALMVRWGWLLRAVASLGLLFLGMWWQLVDLKSAVPNSNLIDPDEADELERQEKQEAGEPGFCLFEHTADVGLEARGKNWADLLEQAALGLMATIGKLEPDAAERGETVTIKLAAPSREELLHDWLAELLYYFETREQMVERVRFREATDTHIIADVTLRPIDRHSSDFHREVKAVTYHEIEIMSIKRGLSARVILDI